MKKRIFVAVYIIMLILTLVVSSNLFVQQIDISETFILLLLVGCGLELLLNKYIYDYIYSIGMVTLMLIILFSNLSTLIVAVTLIVITMSINNHKDDKILNRIFKIETLFIWSSIFVVAYVFMFYKRFFYLDLNSNNIIQYGKVFILSGIFIIVLRIIHNMYYALINKKVKSNFLFGVYIALTSTICIFEYHDRGLILTLLFYILLVPALQLSTMYQKLKVNEDYANKDDLTGIYNGRYFRKLVNKKICNDEEFTLLFIDIDKFKNVNDKYGHIAGDMALIIFAKTIEEILGEHGILTRYAGDEFIAVINRNEDNNAIISKLNEIIKHIEIENNGLKFYISGSMGIYHHTGQYSELNKIIHEADINMYSCKNEHK